MWLTKKQIKNIGFRSIGKKNLISDKAVFYNPERIIIGNHSRIDDFTLISAGGIINIGDYVHIAAYSSIVGKGDVNMGSYSGLSQRVSVFSSSDKYDGEYMTNPMVPEKCRNTFHFPVFIDDHAVIGAGSIILPGAIINKGCAIGAMSLVKGECQEDSIMCGVPVKKIGIRKLNIYELEKLIDAS